MCRIFILLVVVYSIISLDRKTTVFRTFEPILKEALGVVILNPFSADE